MRQRRGRDDDQEPDTPEGRHAPEIERLKRENERLREQLAEQAKRIADLERQLALRQQNSTTTSKPPSSDGLAGQQRERGRRVKSRRRAGGQPGHPGHHRELVPLERVDTIVDLMPDACRRCAHRLHARHGTGDPRRHQVTELPPIAAHITEYRCHRRQCPACGTTTVAPLPDDLAGQFGPQLSALIAYLTVVCRLPRLVVQRLLAGALHIPMSLGSTQKAWEEASAAVAAPCQELEQALSHQPVLHSDETGHRTNGEKRWLWTLVAPTFVVYTIAASRSATVVLTRMFGAVFAGILITDRLPTYTKYHQGRAQFCWAHFTRNLLSAQELAQTAAARRFCREALALQRRLFRLWHRFRGDPHVRGGPITREQLITKALPLEQAFFALGERYVNADDDIGNLAKALFVHHPHFFTFVHEEGVDPTNNVAERALRTAVQWRKIMFGNRSAEGELAVARLLTVTRTCQMQQLNTLMYLTAAIRSYRRRQAVASLLLNRSTP